MYCRAVSRNPPGGMMINHWRRWLECEDQFIRTNRGRLTFAEMERHLGRSEDAIAKRCQRLVLPAKDPLPQQFRKQLAVRREVRA